MDETAAALDGAPSSADCALVQDREQRSWRDQLKTLVDEHPDAAGDLRALLDGVRTPAAGQPTYHQHNTAFGPGPAIGVQGGNVIIHQAPPSSPA